MIHAKRQMISEDRLPFSFELILRFEIDFYRC
jgi:hypothetical protein